MSGRPILLLSLLVVVLFTQRPVEAKSAADYEQDAKDYVLSPLHWDVKDWEWLAGTAAGVAATYSVDDRVRDRFADSSASQKGDPHSLRDAAPAIALTLGTLAAGTFRHDDYQKHVGYDMVEAIALGTASSFVFKNAFGRVRPDSTASRSEWGHAGDSFPSGHVTAAFAAAQVFADSRPAGEWQWRALAYSLAVATAYARVNDNMHWTSDVVAGAALGIATGRFVSNRDGSARRSRVSFSVEPLDKGAMLTFSIDPR